MRRLGFVLAGLAAVAAVAMLVVVGTAPNDFPTPVTWGWGRTIPEPAGWISLLLSVIAAGLLGLAVAAAGRWRHSALRIAAVPVCFAVSEVALLGLNMVAWRLHAPVGPGYG